MEIRPNTFTSGTAGLPTRPTGFHNSHKFNIDIIRTGPNGARPLYFGRRIDIGGLVVAFSVVKELLEQERGIIPAPVNMMA